MFDKFNSRRCANGRVRAAVFAVLAAAVIFSVSSVSISPAFAASAMSKDDVVTIYHLEGRRSFRVVWLCEELGIPYKLMFKPTGAASPTMFKESREMLLAVNPKMPMYPTVVYHGHVLVESGAILQFLMSKYGHGRLEPAHDSDDYPYYLQWMHFAEGTAMARAQATFYAAKVAGIPITQVPRGYKSGVAPRDIGEMLIGLVAVWDFMEDFLSQHPYFGGQNFSAADIMMQFVVGTYKLAGISSISQYPHIDAWRKKIATRPAYLRALKVAIPQGVDADGWPNGMPNPSDTLNQATPPMRAHPN